MVLECKGTHYRKNVLEQLGKAAYQLRSVQVGGTTPHGLMMSTLLGADRIVAHVLDPEGDDELWQGNPADLDEEPEQLDLTQQQQADPADELESRTEQLSLFPTEGAAGSGPPRGATRSAAQTYPIPAAMKGWFARVLNRTATAAALLFAGDQSRARDLIGERQRQRSFGSHEPEPMPLENRNTGIGTVRGTAYRLRWAGGRRMEVFNGVDLQVLNAYNERGASAYLTSAKAGQPRPF